MGDVFDQLTVESFEKVEGKRLVAVCRCSCGKTIRRRPYLFKNNQTNSCGCRPNGAWQGVGKLSGTFFYRTKKNAKTRGLVHDVSIEYCWGLFESQKGKCALTGKKISFSRKNDSRTTASLDRIDSSKGYVEGNVQWVHKHINRMKLDHSSEEFIKLCCWVADYSLKASSTSSTHS